MPEHPCRDSGYVGLKFITVYKRLRVVTTSNLSLLEVVDFHNFRKQLCGVAGLLGCLSAVVDASRHASRHKAQAVRCCKYCCGMHAACLTMRCATVRELLSNDQAEARAVSVWG